MSEQLPAIVERTEIIGDVRRHVVPASAPLSASWNSSRPTVAGEYEFAAPGRR